MTEYLCGVLNAEPVILLTSITYGIFASVTPLFLFWTRCVQMFDGYSNRRNATNFCSQIYFENMVIAMNSVERDVSEMSPYVQLCGTITTVISVPIMGAWSDFNGRKMPLILSVFALTIYTSLQALAIFLYNQLNVYYFLFAAEIFVGCFGGVAMCSIVASAIVIDDSRKQLERSGVPWRITVSCLCRSLGNILGTLIYSLWAHVIHGSNENYVNGYIYTYLVGLGCCLMALIYSIFFVCETRKAMDISIRQESKSFMKRLWDYNMDTFAVLVRPRVERTRLCLCLVIAIMFVDFVNLDNSLQMLYFKRQPFAWPDQLFNKYLIFKNVLVAVGLVVLPFSLRLVSCVGKESLLLMAAILANSMNAFLTSIANSTELIFIAVPLFFVGCATIPTFNTVISKMVKQDETARLFSAICLMLVLSPLFSKAVLYRIYSISLATHPSLVFMVIAGLLFATFLTQMLVHYLMYPQWSNAESKLTSKIALEPLQSQEVKLLS